MSRAKGQGLAAAFTVLGGEVEEAMRPIFVTLLVLVAALVFVIAPAAVADPLIGVINELSKKDRPDGTVSV